MSDAVEDKLDLIGETLTEILAELREIRLAQIGTPTSGDMNLIHSDLAHIAQLLKN